MNAKLAISWSGGKDSCLAWLHARDSGAPVSTFVTMCEADGTSKAHQLPPALLQAQARAAGMQGWQVTVGDEGYAAAFDAVLRRLRDSGHEGLVFGDIDLQAHRDWLELACGRAGLQAWFPLWGLARADVAQQVLARGIRARLVCVDTRWLDAGFCGADYDAALLARLPAGVCCCGEGGEFHTFVWQAPGFAAPLALAPGVQRRLRSRPPLADTELIVQIPELR